MNPSTENETLTKILNAAREVFSKDGFNGARIDRIAKVASVNKAMIYYHFKSKEELYEAVVDSIFYKDGLHSIVYSENLSSFEKLKRIIAYFFEKMEINKNERCSIIAREMVSRSDIFLKMRDKYWIPDFKIIMSIIKEGKDKGEFQFKDPIELISFTILSHIVFYKINQVTYKDSELYDLLYPDNNQIRMTNYLYDILEKILKCNT